MLATYIRAPLLCTFFGLLPGLVIADEVKTFPVKGIDLTMYKTYMMLPVRVLTKSGVQENDPNISPFIVKAVKKELAKKGLTEVSGHADLQVAAGGLGAAIPQVEALIYNFSMDADWSTGNVTTIGRYNREGTLIVNLIDPKTNKSVWVGFAKRGLGRPSKLENDVDKAAQALFKKYPGKK